MDTKKQVLIRTSLETYERLQSLSQKYGLSASGLIVSLVNQRWLQENSTETAQELKKPEPKKTTHVQYDEPPYWQGQPSPDLFKPEVALSQPAKARRKRRKPKG